MAGEQKWTEADRTFAIELLTRKGASDIYAVTAEFNSRAVTQRTPGALAYIARTLRDVGILTEDPMMESVEKFLRGRAAAHKAAKVEAKQKDHPARKENGHAAPPIVKEHVGASDRDIAMAAYKAGEIDIRTLIDVLRVAR